MRKGVAAVLTLLLSLGLSACVGARPDGAQCPVQDTTRYTQTARAAPSGPINILVLSGGGAWGAYGAGFLNGWSERYAGLGMTRPQFDAVTGVSTGAIIAPFALLGRDYDATLAEAFRGVSSNGLFRQRAIAGLPFWNSLKDPEPLRRAIAAALDDRALDRLAAATKRRALFIGAVNFDSGAFTEFELTHLAATRPHDEAREAMLQRIMAASAVPGFFPPQFIGGCMYMDGAVRENVFLADMIKTAIGAPGTDKHVQKPEVTIYTIVNGPLAPRPAQTENTLVGVGVRGFELAANQIQRDSLRAIHDYAAQNGYRFLWTSAENAIAKADEKPASGRCAAPASITRQFSAGFTACLFDAGKAQAMAAPNPWRSDRP
ncbi:MAG: patatin-like phospholipase family protein [Alphaproteobacteria bacterium]|nr:patatin-like phospholipase family protein [Alphaproteobacteria bacterium]